MKDASSGSSIHIDRSTLRMSAQLLPLLIRRLLSDALFTAPLLSHQTVIAGRVEITPALDSASSMTLIANSPNSSPLYDPADNDSSENEPASRSPVVLSISIQPAPHTKAFLDLSYDPSVAPTKLPARSASIIQATSKP